MHRPLPLALLAVPLMAACSDYYVYDERGLGMPYDGDGPSWSRVGVAFQVAFQRGDWGASTMRCQVEVAFLDQGQRDGMFMGGEGAVIDWPQQPGSCRYTSFAEEDQARGLWSVRGSLQGGEVVWLHGQDDSLELTLQQDDLGRWYYGLEDCSEERFPFAAVFDLEVPGGEGAGALPGVLLEQVFVAGADLVISELPAELDEHGWLQHDQHQTLELAWEYLQPLPALQGQPLVPQEYAVLRNMLPGDPLPFEALTCQPQSSGELHIAAADLALLEPTLDPGIGDPYVAFQVDTWLEGPAVDTPWGTSTRVTSTVSEGGTLILDAATD